MRHVVTVSNHMQTNNKQAVHQAVVAHGQALCQRRSSRAHRDLLPRPAGASDRVGRGVKQFQLQGNTREATTFTVALQHGSWPAGHVCVDRARGQDRRRLAGAALAQAHSSRHVRERLGNHDDAPATRGRLGRRTIVNPSLGHGQRSCESAVACLCPRNSISNVVASV